MSYRFVARLSPGLVRLSGGEFGMQLWSVGWARKDARCMHRTTCGLALPKGTRTYRPITNGNNRMHRIGEACMALMEEIG